MPKANSKYKDALFKIVFGENPENALSLYNAINNTEYTNIEDLNVMVLKDSVYIGIKNDVSFLFNHDINLYEHQSTYCPNMPLRGLGYFADLYKVHLGGEKRSKVKMYGSRLLRIPAPKYYVFYNGKDVTDEREDLYLSSAYDGDGDIEVVAHMVNVNKGCNKELMERCRPMAEYSEFVNRVREYIDEGDPTEESIDRAIDDCIRDGIMAGFLMKERDRVKNMMVIGLTEEEKEYLHKIECEEALEKGIIVGREEGTYKAIDRFVADGVYDAKRACDLLGVDIEEYNRYLANGKGVD